MTQTMLLYMKTYFSDLYNGLSVRLRDLLSKLKWDPREDFAGSTIFYLDRSLDDHGQSMARLRCLKGKDVLELAKGYMVVKKGKEISCIPFHRVKEIKTSEGTVRWSYKRR